MDVPLYVWAATLGAPGAMLALDRLVLHRDAHEVSMREAALTSAVWVTLGVLFGVGVSAVAGGDRAGEHFAGSLIEKSLSVDNIFVFALIFGYFAVPEKYQHRVLFWGVVGALVMRAGFIAAGATLLDRFSWTVDVFGAFLLVTGVRMAAGRARRPGPQPAAPPAPPRAHDRRLRGAALLRAPCGPPAGDADAGRAARRRDHGRRPRRRLHPRHLRRHRRAVPRLHVECPRSV